MLERLLPAPTRSLAEVTDGMPGRGRSLAEIAWLLTALLGLAGLEGALALSPLGATAQAVSVTVAVTLLVVAAYALVRPWRFARAGRRWLAIGLWLGLAPIAALTVVGPVLRTAAPGPRIGVELDDGKAPDGRAVAVVRRIEANSPADGRLAPGDRILAVNGDALAVAGPAGDLVARAASEALLPAGDAQFTVVRDGAEREVRVPIAAPAPPPGLRGAFRATLLRNFALLLLLAALLLADGQGLGHLGLEPRHLGTELLASVPALGGLLLAHFAVSVAVTLVAVAAGGELLDAELVQRSEVVGALVAEHIKWTLPLVLVASATEEVVFRGFLLPRLRVATGSWAAALCIGAACFGLGHIYEGTLATVQTAGVGFVLGLIFLWRRRLLACIVAHVGFNTLALLLALLVVSLGLLERAQDVLQQ